MIRIFADHEAVSAAVADYWVTVGKRCISSRGKFDLVISGGPGPIRSFEILAAQYGQERKLWDHTHLYWADERCVPKDSPQSNYGQAKKYLLDIVKIPDSQVHPMPGDREDPRQGADEYNAIFPLSVDLLILGMGPEGHTASIFPHSPVITETRRHVVFAEVPADPNKRITITPRVMANAGEVLMQVSGSEKADALHEVFSETGNVQETPAVLVRKGLWFVDKAAAERMTKQLVHEGS